MKLKNALVLAVATIVLATAGCMPRLSDYRRVTPQGERAIIKNRAFTKEFDAVWSATIRTLSLQGYSIQNQDKSSGTIFTDYLVTKEPNAFSKKAGFRHKLNLIVEKMQDNSTQVTITPTFEFNDAVSKQSRWEKIARPGDQQNMGLETQLLGAIDQSIR